MVDVEQAKTHPRTPQGDVENVAHGIRKRVLEHVLKNNEGYLSQSCSSADILAVLYTNVMRLGPSEAPMLPPPFSGVPQAGRPVSSGGRYNGPKAPELDRFIFSPSHYALALYATLIEVGRMSPAALDQFNQDGSTVEMIGAEHSPGIEVTGGSLAQAISQAGGIALARKLRGDSGRVWVFMSDGEFQEGQTWEALGAISFYELNNIAIYVDMNGYQCDGKTETVMNTQPLAERLRAFGWDVHEVDGHDAEALVRPTLASKAERPLVVLAMTDPCRGLEVLRLRAPNLHYVRFKNEEERQEYQSAYERMCRQ